MGVVFLASAALLFLVTWGAEWSVLLVFPVTVVAFLLAPDAVGVFPWGGSADDGTVIVMWPVR